MKTTVDGTISKTNKAVGTWLLAGVAMLIIQILLGGITRLTGSGLSITEWKIVTGSLPPLNEHQWMAEFEKYRQTPQFQLVNADFTLPNFKFIFFWEWFHRLWARLIGLVFALGFVYFLITRKFKKEMIIPLLILFLLGALQGLVGWIMVMSGLDGDAVYVKPTKLAMHFILALGLLGYTFWFSLKLLVPASDLSLNRKLRQLNWWILFVLILQLLYGALMAGHKAAPYAATWPDINGQAIPLGLYLPREGWINFINNKILIHFIHRALAYTLVILVILWTLRAMKMNNAPLLQQSRWLPLIFIGVQAVLGIAAVLLSPRILANHWGSFEWMAQLHQFTGMLFFLITIWMLFINKPAYQAAGS